jgi:hypothetical protein
MSEYVWIIESGDYEQRGVDGVASTPEAAIAWLKKDSKGRWDEPVMCDDECWTITGHWEFEMGVSSKHSREFQISRYQLR